VKFEIEQSFLEDIDRLAERMGVSRSECVARCVVVGLMEYRREKGLD
jgi:metal-responsive CopG/Arc/MetJ family transcriptional regulator